MKQFLKNKVLFWLPRILGIACVIFLGIFAFDVFEPGRSWLYMLGAFLIHLLPNYVLLVALVVGWRNELYGGMLYLVVGVFGTIFFQTYTFLPNFLLISCPVFVIGMLFLWDYFLEKGRSL